MTGDARWTALFDRLALFLTILGFLLREWTSGSMAGPGLNLFIHLLFWVSLTLWFAGRATTAGGAWRFTGFEFAFLAFAAFSLLSVLRASFKLAALDHALAFLSLALFFVLCTHVLGRKTLLSMLLATVFAVSLYAVVQRVVLFPMIQPAAKSASVEMAWRIQTNLVFARFIGPNQLAGFLALLLPVVAGSMKDSRDFRLRGAILAMGLLALAFTGSKGGWAALGCGAATMAALAATRSRGRTIAVSIGGGAAAVAVGLLLWSPLLSALEKSHSVHVRAVYWRATGRIVASAPMLGVGLDNWQEHYFHAKSDVQQETTKTHNDYLQILSETGVFGLLALGAILGLGLRKGLRREAVADPDLAPPPPLFISAVVGILIVLGLFASGDFVESGLILVVGTAWLGCWHLLRRLGTTSDSTWTRMGAVSGLVALMVHMTAEFQLYEFGIAFALVAVLALLAMLGGPATEVRLPRSVCLAATGILLALCVPLLMFVAPRAMAADTELEQARLALSQLESGRSANPTMLISDAIRVTESAQAHNPLNPEAYQLFSRAKFHEWDLLQKAGARDAKTLETSEAVVLQALENALAVRPMSAPLHYEKSQMHRVFRRAHLKSIKDPELSRAKAAEHLRLAVDHQRRATELYPTFSRNAYRLARLLELSRDPEAEKYYREALRLDKLAGEEFENLDRLKLDPLARARALRAIGKPFEAHDLLVAHFKKAIEGLKPEDARMRLERVVKAAEEDLEEGMAPVLKDVVDAIMRDLK